MSGLLKITKNKYLIQNSTCFFRFWRLAKGWAWITIPAIFFYQEQKCFLLEIKIAAKKIDYLSSDIVARKIGLDGSSQSDPKPVL